jgi:hypothetical protein
VGELNVDDLIAFSGGRLADDDETQRVLDAAVAAVRRYCRWHVCPVRENDAFTVDGPNSRALWLPTKRLLALHSIVENDVVIYSDSSGSTTTEPYWRVSGRVTKTTRAYWTWKPRSIDVVIDHGYTEAEAADWRAVVLGVADRMSLSTGFVGAGATMSAGPYSIGAFSLDGMLTLEQQDLLAPYVWGQGWA